jgi:GNAT superfamily N-acetyltransferase
MKDAKGHGSDPRGGPAHQAGVNALQSKAEQQALSDKWNAAGVRNFIADRPDRNEIQLADLVVPKDQRGTGVGSQFMHELTDMADRHGRTVTLTPAQRDDNMGTTSKSRLQKFYGGFGFVRNKGRNTDFTISDTMYRKPKP